MLRDGMCGGAQGSGLFGWRSGPVADGVVAFGVPSDVGNGASSGARHGPAAIRQASLALAGPTVAGVDIGDVQGLDELEWSDAITRIQTLVGTLADAAALPLLLGGDHSVSYSAIAALAARQRINIVWFDAHTDCCTWTGGAWHNHKQVLRRCASLPGVGRIIQVGHRGVTYHDERHQLPALEVVPARAARTLQGETLLALLPPTEAVYMSIDIDVLDPWSAPGTGHPVPGGLELQTVAMLASAIAAQRPLAGLDLTEVNPLLDVGGRTAAAAASILASVLEALQARRRGRADLHEDTLELDAQA